MTATRLVEQSAADGSLLFDLVVGTGADERVIYRANDREHAASVQRDLAQGRLDPQAVQAVLTEVILRRDGGPRTLFVRGMPLPRPWRAGAPSDRWTEAQARIAALRQP